MTRVVNDHGGTLDKFVGDCIMVLFGAPDEIDDHAQRAVTMAWKMQHRIDELNAAWEARGHEPLSVGMGIHTGFATVGNFGSELFSDYTAIGNSVNLAARIESASEPGQILMSEATQALVARHAETRDLGERTLKGIKNPVAVYELVRLKESSPEKK
jgi:class 3 adenylate cyclase